MKFAVVVFVASFCLAAVTAKAIEDETLELESFLKKAVALKELNIGAGIIGIGKKALNCVKDEVQQANSDVEECISRVKNCGETNDESVKELQKLLDEANAIANRISNSVRVTCEAGENITITCWTEVMRESVELGEKLIQISWAIIKIRRDRSSATECVAGSLDDLFLRAVKYPSNIKACQKNSF